MPAHLRALQDARVFGKSFLWPHARSGEGSLRVARTRFGALHYRPEQSDLASFRQVFGGREYDIQRFPQWQAVKSRYEDILAAGGTPFVLDAGGNVGAASIFFADLLPGARIVCVEPDADNARIARLNTAARPQIEVVEAALGSTAGCVEVRPHHSGDAWAISTVRSGHGVPVVTVEDCLRRVG